MMDYNELAETLRCCANREGCNRCHAHDDCGLFDLRLLAADAIESLLGMKRRAEAAIEELQAQIPHWISVEERLPEVNERVLACVGIPGDLIVYDGVRWNGEEWEVEVEAAYDYWTAIDNPVTHWMPLPEPPKEDAE